MRIAALVCLASTLCFGDQWYGALVSSKCSESEERNVNPDDTLTAVDRDRTWEVQYCSPNAKTKVFALVPQYGSSLKLDSAGNQKAAELVRQTGKKALFLVNVSGEEDKNTIKVDSISVAK